MAGLFSSYSRVGLPAWFGEAFDERSLIPGGALVAPAQFPASDSIRVTASAAGAAAGAVAIPLATALLLQADGSPLAVGQVAIPAGALVDFGGAKLAITTTNTVRGATTLAVRALPAAIAAGDTGLYSGIAEKNILSGTLVGRTIAERDGGGRLEPWTAGDDDFYLVMWDAWVGGSSSSDEVDLVRPGTIVKENWLPGWATLPAPMRAAIRGRYQCIVGAPSAANPYV
jgi:hypothetical protein